MTVQVVQKVLISHALLFEQFPTYDQASFSSRKWSFQQITAAGMQSIPGENYVHGYSLQFASLKACY